MRWAAFDCRWFTEAKWKFQEFLVESLRIQRE